jgi:hypothetical protein
MSANTIGRDDLPHSAARFRGPDFRSSKAVVALDDMIKVIKHPHSILTLSVANVCF